MGYFRSLGVQALGPRVVKDLGFRFRVGMIHMYILYTYIERERARARERERERERATVGPEIGKICKCYVPK